MHSTQLLPFCVFSETNTLSQFGCSPGCPSLGPRFLKHPVAWVVEKQPCTCVRSPGTPKKWRLVTFKASECQVLWATYPDASVWRAVTWGDVHAASLTRGLWQPYFWGRRINALIVLQGAGGRQNKTPSQNENADSSSWLIVGEIPGFSQMYVLEPQTGMLITRMKVSHNWSTEGTPKYWLWWGRKVGGNIAPAGSATHPENSDIHRWECACKISSLLTEVSKERRIPYMHIIKDTDMQFIESRT